MGKKVIQSFFIRLTRTYAAPDGDGLVAGVKTADEKSIQGAGAQHAAASPGIRKASHEPAPALAYKVPASI